MFKEFMYLCSVINKTNNNNLKTKKMEKKIFRNVYLESVNTVFANVEIVSISDNVIQFIVSVEQYEITENALIKSGINITMLVDGNILLTVGKSKSNFEIVRKDASTYDNVCIAIQNIECIKDNNNVIFNNPGLSSTEAVCRDSLIIALDYLKRAKEALRNLGYNR